MTKGIRAFANKTFLADLPQRAEIGNTEFRRNVVAQIVAAFEITVASASTHYNHAFKTVKDSNPELVEGLGRADDKKGGRKPKVKAEVGSTVDSNTPNVVVVSDAVSAALEAGALPAEAAALETAPAVETDPAETVAA